MANSLTQYLDPNLLTPAAAAGTAQVAANQQAGFWASLFQACNMVLGREIIDTTASTVNLTVIRTSLKISGTMAVTLPNGTFEGQRKIFTVDSAAATPALTLTITTADATTGHVTNAAPIFWVAGQEAEYVWTTPSGGTAAWRAVRIVRAGSRPTVVGTTVLTGDVMTAIYALSVTGTVHSLTTMGIPNGQVAGEVIHLVTPTAATIPLGDIAMTGTTVATGAAATSFAGINATSCEGSFLWDPINSWQNIKLTTATFS
jgi:hypothetical protein